MKKLLNIIKILIICISLVFNFTLNCEGYDKETVGFIIALICTLMISHKVHKILLKKMYGEEEMKKEAEDLKEIADFISEQNNNE